MPPQQPFGLIDRAVAASYTWPLGYPCCRSRKPYLTNAKFCGSRVFTGSRHQNVHSRFASTTASVTAVNTKREIPHAFERLHASLKALETDARLYVDATRVQLALRGIESEDAIIRVAVLGLNSHYGARRLTRALLADPLASEAPWERQLTGTDVDEKATILRYGEEAVTDDRHPLVRTISIPSSVLQNHKLEILINTTNVVTRSEENTGLSFLMPALKLRGRPSMVTYPVHKALVYEEGLKNLGTFATIETDAYHRQDDQTFKGVIDWSWSISQQGVTNHQPVSPINLALAEAGIDVFRKSLDKSVEYEHLWFDAGMPSILRWVTEGTEAEPGILKPTVRSLIQAICDTADQAIQSEEEARLAQEKAETVTASTKEIIDQGISTWAENAHTELRDRLNVAFNSKNWRKTKWWKLFWRVDDVGYIASDVLQRAWLVDAEKGMIWLSGRIHQAGLLGPPKLGPISVPALKDEGTTLGRPPRPIIVKDVIPKASVADFTEPAFIPHLWPQHIFNARSLLSLGTIAPLQSLSQALLLQTISTSVLASSLSALLYVSVSTTSPYEAGAIAAAGLVYSLRRLQKRWETGRTEWEGHIREEGRRVLREAEETARETVREGGIPEVDELTRLATQERIAAKDTVRRVTEALDELKE